MKMPAEIRDQEDSESSSEEEQQYVQVVSFRDKRDKLFEKSLVLSSCCHVPVCSLYDISQNKIPYSPQCSQSLTLSDYSLLIIQNFYFLTLFFDITV